MSYNGSGVYTLPGAQLVNGEVVSATENNTFRNDVATALNTAWTRDGQAPASANIPMNNHKFTGLAAGSNNGDSVRYEQVTSDVDITGGTITGVVITDLVYDGSLTGTGNADITGDVSVDGKIITTTGVEFPDGNLQTEAFFNPVWTAFTSSGTYTVPAGLNSIRVYAFGSGGNGATGSTGVGGGGGGCAFGDIAVSGGDTVTISISSGISTVSIGGTTYLTANPGSNGGSGSGGGGGTASKDASVTNGGAYTGGAGGATTGGGGSAASPLGGGYAGGASYGGGGGIGGAGGSNAGGGGGAGGAGVTFGGGGGGSGGAASRTAGGIGRTPYQQFADPLLALCNGTGGCGFSGSNLSSGSSGGYGGGGGGIYTGSGGCQAGTGGPFGGGGGVVTNGDCTGGTGGAFAGGGGCSDSSASSGRGGAGGVAGGGGAGTNTGGAGGSAVVLVYSNL